MAVLLQLKDILLSHLNWWILYAANCGALFYRSQMKQLRVAERSQRSLKTKAESWVRRGIKKDISQSFFYHVFQDGLQQRLAITKAKKRFLKLGFGVKKPMTCSWGWFGHQSRNLCSILLSRHCWSILSPRSSQPEEEEYLAFKGTSYNYSNQLKAETLYFSGLFWKKCNQNEAT